MNQYLANKVYFFSDCQETILVPDGFFQFLSLWTLLLDPNKFPHFQGKISNFFGNDSGFVPLFLRFLVNELEHRISVCNSCCSWNASALSVISNILTTVQNCLTFESVSEQSHSILRTLFASGLSSSLLELVCKCTVLLRNRLLDYVSPLRRHCSKIR